MGNGHKFNGKEFSNTTCWMIPESPNAFTLQTQTMARNKKANVDNKFYQILWALTVPSPRWWTVQGISTIEPTCDVMLVKFVVLKNVISSVSLPPDNWFELFFVLFKFNPSLLLTVVFLILLKLSKLLLESLIELGTVKFPKGVDLSRSKIFVWFCSTFFGIIKKPLKATGERKKNKKKKVKKVSKRIQNDWWCGKNFHRGISERLLRKFLKLRGGKIIFRLKFDFWVWALKWNRVMTFFKQRFLMISGEMKTTSKVLIECFDMSFRTDLETSCF